MKTLTRFIVGGMTAIALIACNQGDVTEPQLDQGMSSSNLDEEHAALAEAMGDEADEVLDLIAEEAAEEPCDKPEILNKHKDFYLMAAWGQLRKPKHGPLDKDEVCSEGETPEPSKPTTKPINKDKASHWTGFIETNAQNLKLARTIRFEKNDEIVPCIDGECVGFDTVTGPGMDGVLVKITAVRKEGDKPMPQMVRVAINNSNGAALDVEIPLHELPGLHKMRLVDDNGNRVALRGFARKPGHCPHGRMRGRLKAQTETKGSFHGKWIGAHGDKIGHVGGVYHKTGAKAGTFVGAFTNPDGALKGLLKGRFHAVPVPADSHLSALARYKGKALNFQGEVIGFVRGSWFRTEAGKTGFKGAWRANCHEDRAQCSDETDPAGSCISTEIVAACSAVGCELIGPRQKLADYPFVGSTALYTWGTTFPETVSLTVQQSDMVFDASEIMEAVQLDAADGYLVETRFKTSDLPWSGEYEAMYTSTFHPMPTVFEVEGAKLSDSLGAVTYSKE